MSELKLVLRKKEKDNGPAAVNTAAGQPRLVVRNKVTGAVSPAAQNTGSRKLVIRQSQSGMNATAQGLNDLMRDVSSFFDTVSTDFANREGKYQSGDAFGRYKADTLAKANGYAAKVAQYRRDLTSGRANYEATYGTQTITDALKWLDEAEKHLGTVRTSLDSEAEYWGNFADEATYNRYIEVEQLAGTGTEALKSELDAVNTKLARATTQARFDGDAYRRNPGQRGQMAQTVQQATEEKKKLTDRKRLLEAALERAQIRETDSRYEGQSLEAIRTALTTAQQDRARAQERAQYLGSGAASRQGERVTQADIDAAWAEHDRLAKQENELKQVVERRFPTYYADLQQEVDFIPLSKVDHSVNDETYRAVNGLGSDTGKRTVGDIVLASKGVGNQEKKEKQARFLENMNAAEVGTYNYIYKKFGAEEAQDYLDRLEETINARAGKKTAEKIQDIDSDVLRWGATMGHAVGAGLDSFVQGTKQNFHLDPLPTSATQYASQELMQDLGGFNRFLYSGLNTVGNMLPSILLSKLTGGLGGATLGKVTGAATMGLSASGNAYKQAMIEGYDGRQAQTYSMLVGASEATLQYLIGGIGSLGGVSDDVLLAKAAKLDKWYKRMAATGAIKIGSEITEEELQLFLEPAIKSIVMDIPYDAPNFDEMMETAIVTALSTLMMEGKAVIKSGLIKPQTAVGAVDKPAAPVKTDVEPVTIEGQMETAAPEMGTAETDVTENVGEEANPADAIPDESVALPIVPSSDPKVQREFNRAAKIAGNFGCKLVVGVPEGGGDGSYQNGIITIAPNCENPVMQVLLHELTHRLENSKQYGRLTELVRRQLTARNVDVEEEVQAIVEQAESRGESMTPGYAMRELVAQYVQTDLFQNEQEIQRLLREERSVFDAIRDWLNDAVHWLKGNLEQKRIIRAQRLFEKALRTSDPKMGMSGAQHLYAGENAATADREALERAKMLERDGADMEYIRQDTGWFRGMDGKWRFEIDDSGMVYERHGFTENPDVQRRRELEDKMLRELVTAEEWSELQNLTKATKGVPGPSKLSDYIRHEGLFAAYPELRDAKVVFAEMEGRKDANYNPRTNTITVNERLRNAPEGELLHELQHAVQEIEGFASGSSRDYWERRMEQGYSRRWSDSGFEMMPSELYRNTAGEIEARDTANRRGLDEDTRRQKTPDMGNADTVFADGTVSFNADEISFRKQIDAVLDGKMDAETTHLNMGQTPEIYGGFGLRTDLPILITANHVKNMNAKVDLGTGTPHAMTRGQIAAIPQKVANPVMVMVSASQKHPNRLVVVTDIVDSKKRPVIVVLQPDGTGNYMNAEIAANIATSGYGKDGFKNYVMRAFSDGRMLWCDYEKSHQLQQTPGVQFPNNLPHGDFTDNIAQYAQRVKSNRSANLEYYESMADVPEDDWRPLQKTEDVDGDDTSSVTADAAQGEGVEADPVESLPRKAREYLSRVERALTGKIGYALSVPKGASREFLEPIVRYMSNEFLTTGKVSRETLDSLFDAAYRAGIEVEREYYDTYKFVRDHIKQQAVTISKEDQSDIPDFAQFKKSAADVLKIRKEGGLPVDVAYQELQGMAPELFPESITHPAEQLMKMHEAAKGIEKTEVSLDQYYGDDAATFKEWARRDFDVAVGDMLGEMRAVMRYAAEQTEKRAAAMTASEDEVRQAYNEIRNARKTAEKTVARNLLTDYDNALVGRLLKGEIELDDLDPNRANVKGIREVFEAKREYEKLSRVIREYQKQRRSKLHEQADGFLETANKWKDKSAGILYARETMERNIRDIVEDEKLAKGIVDTYFKPVHDSQAESNRFKNRYRDRVRKLDLSRKVAKGNEVSEAYAVQLIGEAEDNIRVLEESRGRLKNRDGKTAAEWRAEIRELWEKNPELDRAKIEGAVQEFRAIYDELFQQMNEVRFRNGYEPVAYRRGYFPHFQAEGGGGLLAVFGKVLGIETAVTALPTSINGITHTFRPGITWFGNAQERLGYDTVYDAVQGFDKYIEGAADVIHQTDNIQRLRALANRIRYRTTSEGIRKQVDEVMDNKTLTEDEKQKLIQQIYADGKFSLSNFVVELEEYTNILANKKSLSDRNMERLIGRRMYNVVKALESRVAANMVAVNPGSWLTNFIPLTQASAEVGMKDLLQAMWGTLQSYKTPDGLVERSTFLTNRRGSDVLVKDWSKKTADTLSKPMELIDRFTADSIVRAKYAQNLRRGMSEEAALVDADAFAAGVIADRSKGAMPTIFNRSNPVTKLFTQFQLEVNNQFSYLLKDIPKDMRDRGMKALAGALLKFFLGAWLYNEVYEYFIGRRPALDPIGMLNDTVGDLSGWELPNLVELGVGAVTGDLPSFRTEKKDVKGAGAALAKNAAEELPFIGGILDGGRVPIKSALPDAGKLWDAATNSDWSGKKRWSTAAKEAIKPIAYLAPPFGGGQAKKVLEGVEAVARGGSYSVDAAGNDLLQYPVYNDTVREWLGSLAGAATFGKTSLPTARDWVDSGFDTYNKRQTAVYKQMNDAGVSDRDAHQLLNDLQSTTPQNGESDVTAKRRVLLESEISEDGKLLAYLGLLVTGDQETVDRKRDKVANVVAAGATIDDWLKYEVGRVGMKKEDTLRFIDKMDLTWQQKDAFYKAAGYSEKTLEDAPWYHDRYRLPGP